MPGGAGSRPALNSVFATPFPAPMGGLVPTVVYGKSFVNPDGSVQNLFYDSNGVLYVEDFTGAPGVYSTLATSTPAAYCKSSTAFGREYIAISDGLHGQEMPLQFDGTNLDRVTMDGPGAAPSVASVALPSVNIAAGTPIASIPVTEADPTTDIPPFTFYTGLTFWTSASVAALQPGMSITISGNLSGSSPSAMNVTATIVKVATGGTIPGYQNAVYCAHYFPPGTLYGLGGTATVNGAAVTRNNNIVTVGTAAAHQLQPGYQAQVSGLPAYAIGGGMVSIVINNESQPGLALVSTSTPHGLAPGDNVSMTGIPGTAVDTSSSAIRAGGIAQITTSALVNLGPGSFVTLSGFSNASFNVTTAILSVSTDPTGAFTVFTFLQTTDADVTTPATGGTVTLNWPIPDTPTPTYYEVESAPTPTTFYVAVNYSDGTWGSGGVINFAWDGTFFVLTVPNSTTFTYQQYGPNAQATAPTMPAATVTPYGQAAPGLHQMQVLFLTRQGYTTRPSPPVQFMANGGQYISVSNIPIGPPNVIARILAFTGAQGDYFFYLPVAPTVNNQLVGTATQINDNTTTGALLDFSDNSLFAALAISTPGNDLASQIKLDGALGFGAFGSRLITWGQRNCVQNFLNIGFDGGYLPSQSSLNPGWTLGTFPSGWQFTPSSIGPKCALVAGRFNTFSLRWTVTGSIATPTAIFQGAYRDAYGAPILTPNTQYKIRIWLKPSVIASDAQVSVQLFSPTSGMNLIAQINGATMNVNGSWLEQQFSGPTPDTIPSDAELIVNVSSTATSLTVDMADLNIIFVQTPYLDTILYGSYVNNPEGFDGVTGQFGPTDDTHKVMDFGIVRSTMYLFTQEPSGRIHEAYDNGVTEPSGWTVDQSAANCGVLSAFCLTKSQADDQAPGGGEECLAWASSTGALISGGGPPDKINQEIQPDWVGGGNGQLTFGGINPAAYLSVWAVNDYVNRVIYFGLPAVPWYSTAPAASSTAPTLVYPLNYRELNSAQAIAGSPPYHPSFSGHLIATDNCRKWTRWSMTINAAAMMYRTPGASQLSLVLMGGNGKVPGAAAGFGNVYTLNPGLYTDDDYGAIAPYYTTYFFVNRQDELALRDDKGKPVGLGRKLLAYQTAYISGIGTLTITFFADSLLNPWPLTVTRTLAANPTFDQESGGGMCMAQRIAIKFASSAAL